MNVFEIFGTIGLKDDASKGLDGVVDKAEGTSSKIEGIFKKTAAVIGAAFALDKAVDFGKMAVEAAATATATQAQFEQVFEGIEVKAQEKLDGVAKQVGALPNRIKPAFNQIASFAKVTGMSTSKSLSFAERATKAAADSAAWYDTSIEQTTETLKSYLKGNYEVADNLGILSTETTRNAAATELFGKKFKELDGMQQQEVLLKMYEDANKVSGAMDQASREADGWENVMGNLKQAWQDFLAVVGAPLLSMLVPIIKGITSKVQEFAEYIPIAQAKLSEFWDEFINSTLVQSAIDVFNDFKLKVKEVFDSLKNTNLDEVVNKFGELKDAILEIDLKKVIDDIVEFTEKILPLAGGITAAVLAFKLITGITAFIATVGPAIGILMNLVSAVGVVQTVLTLLAPVIGSVGLAFSAISWPIVLIAGLIGALVAAGIWLWQNWSTMGPMIIQLWTNVSTWVSQAVQNILTWMSNLWTQGVQYVSNMASGVKQWFISMWSTAKQKAIDIYNSVTTWFGKLPGKIQSLWNQVVSFLKGINLYSIGVNIVQGLWNGIKSLWGRMVGWFQNKVAGLVKTAQDALSIFSPSRKFRDLIGKMIPQGIQVGVEDEFPKLEDSLTDNLTSLTDIKPVMDGQLGLTAGTSDNGVDMTQYMVIDALDIIIQLLEKLGMQEVASYLDGHKVSRDIDDPLRQYQNKVDITDKRMKGAY